MSENKQESNLETVILLVLRPALGLYFGHFIILIQNKAGLSTIGGHSYFDVYGFAGLCR